MKYLTKYKILEDYNEEIFNNGLSVLPNVSYVENEKIGNKVKFCAKPYRTAKFIPSDTQPYVLLFKDWRNLGNVWVDGVKLDELKECEFIVTKDDVSYTEDGWYELNREKIQNLPHVRSYEIFLEDGGLKDDDELFLLVNAAYGSAMLEQAGTISDCIMQGVVSYGVKKQSLVVNADIFQFGFLGGVGGFILRNGEIINTVNKLIHGTSDELDGIRITNDNWMDIQMPNISSVDTIRLVVDNIDDINDKTYVIGINSGQYLILAPLADVGSYYNNGQLTLPLGGGSLDCLLAFAELDENENVVKVLDSTCYLSIGYQDDSHFDTVMVEYNGQSEINVTFETLNRFVTPLFENSKLSELGKDALKYVTSIGDYAFYSCGGLTEIIIPDSVTTIGDYAFEDCTSLTEVVIPDSVTTIGDYAFDDTPFYDNLPNGDVYLGSCYYKYKGEMPSNTSITIKDGTKSICDSSFSGCTNLTSVTIPSSVTSIGSYAFYGCYFEREKFINKSSVTGYPWGATLYDVIQEDGLCINGTTAIRCRPNATTVTIPSSVTSIGNQAFYGCNSLSSINIPDSVTSIGDGAFHNCSGLTEIVIPDSVTSIGYNAFRNCSGLTEIVIPDSVTSIGTHAFNSCSGLSSITCHATTAPTLDSYVFDNLPTNGKLYVPSGTSYSSWLRKLPSGWKIEYV